jgi:hypothetical protein
MNVIVPNQSYEPTLQIGDIVEITYEDGDRCYYLCMTILLDKQKIMLKNLNGYGYAVMRENIDEIIDYLEAEEIIKSYRIFSQNEYDIVLQFKNKY